MRSFEDLMNADPPPERVHAADVDLLGETRANHIAPIPGGWGIMRFDWQRPDGTTLHYARVVDDDGHWFYPLDEAVRRLEALDEA